MACRCDKQRLIKRPQIGKCGSNKQWVTNLEQICHCFEMIYLFIPVVLQSQPVPEPLAQLGYLDGHCGKNLWEVDKIVNDYNKWTSERQRAPFLKFLQRPAMRACNASIAGRCTSYSNSVRLSLFKRTIYNAHVNLFTRYWCAVLSLNWHCMLFYIHNRYDFIFFF